MKIENLISAKGNKVANQFKVEAKNKTYFRSYQSVVAAVYKRSGKVELYQDWDYSNTTRKYLYRFLRENGHSELCNRKAVLNAIKERKVRVYECNPSL